MQKNIFLWVLFFVSASAFAQKQTKSYQYFLDLTKVKDDKVKVELITPKLKKEEQEFQMPKIVPGTYSIYDYGRFVNDLKAFDKKGKELTVEKLDKNRWKIKSAKKLHKITYWIDDTFDADLKKAIFEPGGSNIEEGKNFTINTFAFFGYLKGFKDKAFDLNIKRPQDMYGATSMKLQSSKDNVDKFTMPNYFDLSDMPIMYCKPDTTSLMVGGAEVMVSVYSPNGTLKSSEVMDNVKKLLLAQKDYLGGTLPVPKYTFLLYLNKGVGKSGAFGALEHSYSTLFFLIEGGIKRLGQTIRSVAAHEFFHIVTPLNIHSEQIGNYDFINPKMSKHLWLYEGGTEYAAQHVQVMYNLFSLEDYIRDIKGKIRGAENYNTPVPFTTMSLGCLDKYEKYYGDVYQKGALINMLLDIRLRQLSDGKYGVQKLMKDLAKKYGKNTSFKDDVLFDEITKMTYPEIRDFFKKYVEGNEPLPYKEYLSWVGIDYKPTAEVQEVNIGFNRAALGFDQSQKRINIKDASKLKEDGKALGFKSGDVIMKYQGKDLTFDTVNEILTQHLEKAKAGDPLTVTVKRAGNLLDLKSKVSTTKKTVKHDLKLSKNPSPSQKKLRKAWINQ